MKGKSNYRKRTKGIRWAFSPDLTRGMIPLDPHKRMLLGLRKKQTPTVDRKYARPGDVMASAPDEPPMTACGGNFIGGEIRRNEQCPLCGLATIEPAERVAIPDAKHPGKAWEKGLSQKAKERIGVRGSPFLIQQKPRSLKKA